MEVVEQAMKQVSFPEMRHELIYDLSALLASGTESPADWRCVVHNLASAIHILYDDSALSEDASSEVGWILKCEDEAGAIRKIVTAMDKVFERFGVRLENDWTLDYPLWVELLYPALLVSSRGTGTR